MVIFSETHDVLWRDFEHQTALSITFQSFLKILRSLSFPTLRSHASMSFILVKQPRHSGLTRAEKQFNSIFSKIKIEQKNFVNLNDNLHDAKINNLYGVMPDWNPAEILGIRPNRLAVSLYSKLIMSDVWSQQRFEFGYKDLRPNRLLYNFCGHSYVNVKSSLKSFIPYLKLHHDLDNLNWHCSYPSRSPRYPITLAV